MTWGVFSSLSAAVLLANMPLAGEAWPPCMTGDDLTAACVREEPAEQGLCIGYIRGVADVLGGPGAKVDGILACLPGGETSEQLVTVVRGYLVAYVLSLSFPWE